MNTDCFNPGELELRKSENPRSLWDQSWARASRRPRRYMVFNWLIYYWLSEVIPDYRNCSFVELGGGGELLAILSRKVRSVTALDVSEEALDRCRALLTGRPNASCVQADLFDFKPDPPYDVSMSFGVIEHFNKETMLESVKAHARCAGKYVVIGVPSDVPHNWWRAVTNLEKKEFPPWKPMDVCDLWPLFEAAGIRPLAATRLDPTCGRRGAPWRIYRLAIKLGLLRRYSLDHRDGGLTLLLGSVGEP